MKNWIRSDCWRALLAAGLVWLGAMEPLRSEEFRFTQAGALAVPDGGGLGVFLQQTVPNLPGPITSVRVALDIEGGWNGDLYAFLTKGDELAVLLNRPGRESGSLAGYGDSGMRVLLDDAAAGGDIHRYRAGVAGPPTFADDGALTGVWAPDGRDTDPDLALGSDARTALLSGFAGRSPAGVWTLFVADLEPGGVHVLRGWELLIEVQTETVNSAPSFVGLTNATIPELVLYTQELKATDHDLPVQSLGFSLVSGPTGAGVTNGVFAWLPGEHQGPSTNEVLVSVTDGVVSVTNSFSLVVQEVNRLPVFAGATNATIPEMAGHVQPLVPQDPDVPTQTLTVSLLSGPAGLVVTNGVLAWTPTEAQGPSTNEVTVSVTDGVASVTNSFNLVVQEVNRLPVFAGATNATIPEMVGHVQPLVPQDPDVPTQTLTVSLLSGPAGLVVTNGVLAWTPTEAQGPSTNEVMVSVSDGVASVTNSFNLVVLEVNRLPVFAGATNATIPEMAGHVQPLVPQDSDVPAQILTVNLLSGPAGLVVTNGVLAWTPTEAQGPSTNVVTVSVNDGVATVTNSFNLVVQEVNRLPAFAGATNATIPEVAGHVQPLVPQDPDVPTQTLTVSLLSGPLGLVVTNGVLAWTPTEAQGPSTNVVTVSVSDGVVSVTNSFNLVVLEVNRLPSLAGATNATIPEMAGHVQPLVPQDPDVPVQSLTVSLLSGPAGLVVTNGVLAWTPTEAQGPSTNEVTVSVNDGVATVTNSFNLVVQEVNGPPVARTDELLRPKGAGLKVRPADLLSNDLDPDGDPFQLVGVDAFSAGGIRVHFSEGWVIYEPGSSAPALDAFGYTIRDSGGLESRGLVNLVTIDPDGAPSRNINRIEVLPDGGVRLHGHGIPGRRYRIETTGQLGISPWQSLGTVLTDAIGTWVFEHPGPDAGEARYYRTLE